LEDIEMNLSTDIPHDQPRAEMRKAQVLSAAIELFRLHGFHNTSMVQISKSAGMSVGHIYHYFENKEAIISAVVDQEQQYLQSIWARIRENAAGGDLLHATADAQFVLDETLKDQNAPLMLEIVAEAARNPVVAGIVRTADKYASGQFRELICEGLRFRNIDFREEDLDGPLDVIYALCEGLSLRAIRNPDMSPKTILSALHRTLDFIIEELIAKAHPTT
jgi:AcrR family transcriptional regulator